MARNDETGSQAHLERAARLDAAGDPHEAIVQYRRAIEANPRSLGAYQGLASLLMRHEQRVLAAELLQHAQAVDPDDFATTMLLAEIYYKQGRTDDAITAYEKACRLDPRSGEAAIGHLVAQLPIVCTDIAETEFRRNAYERALRDFARRVAQMSKEDRAHMAAGVGARQPFYLAYQGRNDRALQELYGETISRLMAARHPNHAQPVRMPPVDGEGRIRVGIVSRFFCNHSNWKIPIKGWVENLDRDRFQLFGYYTGSEQDWATAEAQAACHSLTVGPRSTEDWATLIRADRLHVLIFPEFGMDPDTLRLGCLRIAPIQMASWGHPETSGLPTIDVFLSSDLMEPTDAQDHYSERLVRLPNLSIHYSPFDVTPQPLTREEIGVGAGNVLYWCGQSLYKHQPAHDDVFAAIARREPRARFLFIRYSTDREDPLTAAFQRRLDAAFASQELDYRDHCLFLMRMPTAAFAGTLALSDVFLDTIGWSGCNSALEALPFDLPIVTLPLDLMRARHCAAILTMIGLTETIAKDKDAYVDLAVRIGQDPAFRQKLRNSMGAAKHKLYHDLDPVHALEAVLQELVTGGLAGAPHDGYASQRRPDA